LYGRSWIILGSLSAAMAVGMGAFGAHGLEGWLETNWPDDWGKRLSNWKTAANYQMYHSIGMLIVGLVARFTQRTAVVNLSGCAMLSGILLFSGLLYGWVFTDSRIMVMIVPVGGTLFMVGWMLLGVAMIGSKARAPHTHDS
jgi:uncharacterized membrane protein YgdD (TMEM256/DUF423 family)